MSIPSKVPSAPPPSEGAVAETGSNFGCDDHDPRRVLPRRDTLPANIADRASGVVQIDIAASET